MTPTEERDYLKRSFNNLQDQLDPFKAGFYYDFYADLPDKDPIADIRREIDFSESESRHLFSGYSGTGKSTQLKRLKQLLEAQGDVVLYIDTLGYRSNAEPFDIRTMLLLVAAAVSDAIKHYKGLKIEKLDFFSRFVEFVKKHRIHIKELTAGMSAASIKLGITQDPTFRELVKDRLKLHLAELKREVDDYLMAVKAAFRDLRGDTCKCILILDSLEQVHSSIEDEDALFKSVTHLFSTYTEYLRVPGWHLVYTVPAWLSFTLESPRIQPIVFPHLALTEPRTGKPVKKHRDIMREMLRRRLPDQNLETLFGNDTAATLDRLIDLSGGHPRDFFQLVRKAITSQEGPLPITELAATRSIVTLRNSFPTISKEVAAFLDKVAADPTELLEDNKSETISRVASLLNSRLIFIHRNGETWYEVHPVIARDVAEILLRRPARKAAKKAAKKKK